MERWISILGLLVFMGVAYALSSDRKRVSPRVIIGGLALQFVLAVIVLHVPWGRAAMTWLASIVDAVLAAIDVGSEFIFGADFRDTYIAFRVLPIILVFAALTSVLYHLRVLQAVVAVMAIVMQKTLGTSGAESLAAAANVFLGHTEAPLVIKPYLVTMTRSELLSMMIGGMATVAGSVMGAYIGFGVEGEHLLTASLISAPAALLIAKIMIPETEQPATLGSVRIRVEPESTNVVHALSLGTATGVRLAVNVGAMLLVFAALIALINMSLGWLGLQFGAAHVWTLEGGLGYVFAPVAWLLGVETKDCLSVGQLIGIKTAANEFIAYQQYAAWNEPGSEVILSERTRLVTAYALCGFANFGSIGIAVAGIGALVPERQSDIAKLGVRAMIGGLLAGFMTACVAGILY